MVTGCLHERYTSQSRGIALPERFNYLIRSTKIFACSRYSLYGVMARMNGLFGYSTIYACWFVQIFGSIVRARYKAQNAKLSSMSFSRLFCWVMLLTYFLAYKQVTENESGTEKPLKDTFYGVLTLFVNCYCRAQTMRTMSSIVFLAKTLLGEKRWEKFIWSSFTMAMKQQERLYVYFKDWFVLSSSRLLSCKWQLQIGILKSTACADSCMCLVWITL